MPAILPVLFFLAKQVAAFFVIDKLFQYFQDGQKKNVANAERDYAQGLQSTLGIDKEDATILSGAAIVTGLMSRGASQKQALKAFGDAGGNAKLIEDVLAKRKFISPKARAAIMAALLVSVPIYMFRLI